MDPAFVAIRATDMNPIALSLQHLEGHPSFGLEDDIVLRTGARTDIDHIGASNDGGTFP